MQNESLDEMDESDAVGIDGNGGRVVFLPGNSANEKRARGSERHSGDQFPGGASGRISRRNPLG
ncbi:MAG TPA: hypothetical protein VMH83_14985 [Candidatus Acidoferrum sp.]|nr:hypothetical protein [Candidatus Acidoferrum sp.]